MRKRLTLFFRKYERIFFKADIIVFMKHFPYPFHPFSFEVGEHDIPSLFTCPFHYVPHRLSVCAAEEVQHYLASRGDWAYELEKGKMFGVLVVRKDSRIGFLAAYSGILCGRNDHEYFVPPVFDLLQPDGHFKTAEREISALNRRIEERESHEERRELQQQAEFLKERCEQELRAARAAMKEAKQRRDRLREEAAGAVSEEELIAESRFQKAEYKRLEKHWKVRIEEQEAALEKWNEETAALKAERRQRSARLQEWLFSRFRMLDAYGEEKDLWQLFREYGRAVPPAGAGECAAPKLLQYAYRHGFQPLAMAEFWWGASPETELRRHGYFYPSCKNKCEPILKHMLRGLDVEPDAHEESKYSHQEPHIIYEDEWMMAVDKPSGMLSVAGKGDAPSVQSWLHSRFAATETPLPVHRLDMDTSGVLLIAKNKEIHKRLQQLFETRDIRKRYVALLDGIVPAEEGFIRLPLSPNPDDRPRQMVSAQYGKPAVTRYEVLERCDGITRVAFYPLTGRTHQLRVHAAHPEGLNTPIMGDNLYGRRSERLYLHAESISFRHVVTGRLLRISAPVPF